MTEGRVVRRAEPRDHDWILALHATTFGPLSAPEFPRSFHVRARRMLKRPVWVCEVDGQRAGYVAVDVFKAHYLLPYSLMWDFGARDLRRWERPEDWRLHLPGSWVVTAITVLPGFRRQGVGQALLAACVQAAWDQGIPSCVATCVQGSGSPELFEGQGFLPVLTLPGAYPGPLAAEVVVLPREAPRARVPALLFALPDRVYWGVGRRAWLKLWLWSWRRVALAVEWWRDSRADD